MVWLKVYDRISGIGRGMNWYPLIYQQFLTSCMAKPGRRLITLVIPWWGISYFVILEALPLDWTYPCSLSNLTRCNYYVTIQNLVCIEILSKAINHLSISVLIYLKFEHTNHVWQGTLIALASFSEGKLINQMKSAALLSPIAYLSHMNTALGVVAAKYFVGEVNYRDVRSKLIPKLRLNKNDVQHELKKYFA